MTKPLNLTLELISCIQSHLVSLNMRFFCSVCVLLYALMLLTPSERHLRDDKHALDMLKAAAWLSLVENNG